MILATDLDRTLLPNSNKKDDNTLPLFFDIISKKKITLIYATGRNLKLFRKAKKKYKIKEPDYLIAEVGTVIYKKTKNQKNLTKWYLKEKLVVDKSWTKHLKQNCKNWNIKLIENELRTISGIKLQEKWRQNNYKLSYYINNLSRRKKILEEINNFLLTKKIQANLIFSIDPLKKVGLIDILPKIVTKTTALEFIRKKLGISKKDVIYCGDSGNDIIPLTNGYKSIVVKNASNRVKDIVWEINKNANLTNNVYIAKGNNKLNGNYSSGILEGLLHFGIINEI